MSYEYDLFISYAHIDDVSPFGGGRGWIELLRERLAVMLAQQLGYEPKIWRDSHSLRGNDELGGAIGDGVTRALLLLPVISPRYVQSDWCNRELEAFHAAPPPPTGAAPAFRSRVFKVIKTPLPAHLAGREPAHIRSLIGYQFYGEDESSGLLTEFIPDPSDKRYWKALNRLVADMTRTLIELKHSPAAPPSQATASQATASPATTAATDETPDTTASAHAVNAPAGAGAQATQAGARATEEQASAAGTRAEAEGAAAEPQRFVYLAETTGDLAQGREAVRDELSQRGYGVLPEQRLPLDERRGIEEVVRADLARCALSVHMVGARYGSTPEDDPASVVQIQERLAAERGAADASFQRLLWAPPGLGSPALEISDARQRAFVAELQAGLTPGSELLQTTIEDLKTRAVEKLAAIGKAAASPAAAGGAARRAKFKQIYLICENRDRALIRPIKQHLFKQNFEVITWLEGEGGADKLMEYHRRNLRECDAALIYFGSGDEPWVRKNLEDLEKAYGYGRDEDWTASAVYVGQPPSEQKEDFLTHMARVIRNFSEFNPEDLRDFVEAVRRAEGGGA
ncbi:MAG TPA: toll/interleukin-1 receptor domain-containing protein [Pyrinomonadaceae bacterium]|jgi:hypothetical protein